MKLSDMMWAHSLVTCLSTDTLDSVRKHAKKICYWEIELSSAQ